MGCSKSSAKRKVYSDNNPTSRNNNNKKTSNRQPNFPLKTTGKRRKNPQN